MTDSGRSCRQALPGIKRYSPQPMHRKTTIKLLILERDGYSIIIYV